MLSECLIASQSPRRQNCGADILSARRPRDTSNSSNNSCENLNHRKASFAGVVPSCSRGENRFYTPGSQFSSSDLPVYYVQDANWDTTAVVGFNSTTGTWGVTQRYLYSPYGSITALNADWSTPPAGTQPTVNNLYQGMTLDAVTGLYDERFRNYSPSLGRWISQDPLQYINGANTYQFVGSGPVGMVDPSGRAASPGANAGGVSPPMGWNFLPAPVMQPAPSPLTLPSPGYRVMPPGYGGIYGFSAEIEPMGPPPKSPCARDKWLLAEFRFRESVDHG